MADDDWFTGKGGTQPTPAAKDKPKEDDWFTGYSGDLPAQLPTTKGDLAIRRGIRDIGRGAAKTVVSSGDLLRTIFPPEGGPAWTDPVGAGARGLAGVFEKASPFAYSKPETGAIGKYLGIGGELVPLAADLPLGAAKGMGELAARAAGRAAYEPIAEVAGIASKTIGQTAKPDEKSIEAVGQAIKEGSGGISLNALSKKAELLLKRQPGVRISPQRQWLMELTGQQGAKKTEDLAKAVETSRELEAIEKVAGPEVAAGLRAKFREPGFFERMITGAFAGSVMPEGPERRGEAEGAAAGAAGGAVAAGSARAISSLAKQPWMSKFALAWGLHEMGLVTFPMTYGAMVAAPYAEKIPPRLMGGIGGQAAGTYLP